MNKLCKFIINNLEEFIWDTYANHIVRSCIACLCGKPYLCSKVLQQKGEKVDTNKDHKILLKKYTDNIINIHPFSGKYLNKNSFDICSLIPFFQLFFFRNSNN